MLAIKINSKKHVFLDIQLAINIRSIRIVSINTTRKIMVIRKC